jgi:acyl carrier protein
MEKQVKEIILNSLEEFNSQVENENLELEITEDTVLLGQKSNLDSLDFVSLVMIVEENIFDKLDQNITIASDKAFAKNYNPFERVDKLIKYVIELLKEEE